GRWLAGLHFDRNALMQMWRFAVITYLRGAQKAGVLRTNLPVEDLSKILQTQYERWWSIKIDRFHSKLHFLQYAGRYVRRLPIAQRRFLKITGGEVEFWTKDRRLKRRLSKCRTVTSTPFAISGCSHPAPNAGHLPLCLLS